MNEATKPSRGSRLAVALAFAGVAAALTWFVELGRRAGAVVTDYDHLWIAGRALLAGQSPYAVVAEWWMWGHFYPLPTSLVTVPLALAPLDLARILFIAGGAGAATYAVTRAAWWPLLMVATGPMLHAVYYGQWSTWLIAGVGLPALAAVWIAKPTLGLALFAAWPRWQAATFAILLLAASFAVMPNWVGEWRATIADSTHIRPPITRPGGILLLAALLRWRRPEARLLLALALIPHNSTWADALLLFLIPATHRQALWFAALMLVAPIVDRATNTGATLTEALEHTWWFILGAAYLPALAMVLRRPNDGELAAWWPSRRRREAIA